MVVPAPLSDAALVNAVVTVTEAKVQALAEAGMAGTGTSSDAVCVACPFAPGLPSGLLDGEVEPYGGPRSLWGAASPEPSTVRSPTAPRPGSRSDRGDTMTG